MTATLATIWMPDAASMRLIAPELVLLGAIVAILLAPLVARRNPAVTVQLALIGVILCALAAAFNLGRTSGGIELFGPTRPDGSAGPGMLLADPLSAYFRMFLMVFLAVIIGMWLMFEAHAERSATEFFTLLLASAIGMSLMVSTTNLLMMIIAIEMASLPSYALAGFDKSRRTSAEAAVKYVVFGAATSGFMVYGASLLYGLFGTLHIPTLMERLADQQSFGLILPVALLALFAGIAFKISAVPFHFWCPDVFEGAPLPVATWLSVASKAAGLVLLLRLVFLASGQMTEAFQAQVVPIIQYGVGFFAAITCSFANLAAYRQTNVRRMLAYSSIAHAGYMLMAGAVVFSGNGADVGYQSAMSSVIAYLLVYMFMNLGAFMTVGLVAADTGDENADSFAGLGFRDPLTAVSLTICLISLVGLPPFGGFIVKWWLMSSLSSAAMVGENPSALLWTLVVVLALNTAVSLYYYARIVWQMYFVPRQGPPLQAPLVGKLTVAVCAVVLLLTGTIWVTPLKDRADGFVAGMFTGTTDADETALTTLGTGETTMIAPVADEPALTAPVADEAALIAPVDDEAAQMTPRVNDEMVRMPNLAPPPVVAQFPTKP